MEVLTEFSLLTTILNKEFVNYDYLGGLSEAFKFEKLPRDYEKIARKLMDWTSLSPDETISLADDFVHNFVVLAEDNGIKLKERPPLEKLKLQE
jgi:hypothetical protein